MTIFIQDETKIKTSTTQTWKPKYTYLKFKRCSTISHMLQIIISSEVRCVWHIDCMLRSINHLISEIIIALLMTTLHLSVRDLLHCVWYHTLPSGVLSWYSLPVFLVMVFKNIKKNWNFHRFTKFILCSTSILKKVVLIYLYYIKKGSISNNHLSYKK